MRKKVIWLTGPSKAGKSTIADALKQEIDCINLDGDEMRASVSLKPDGTPLGFTREDRLGHNIRVARLAKELSRQKVVIVSVIAPMIEARQIIDEICQPLWIRIERNLPVREDHFYEISSEYPVIDTDANTVPECAKRVLSIAGLEPSSLRYSLLIGRYQPLHDGHKALIQKVIDEGKKPLVALRETAYGPTDPYTLAERKEMFEKAFGSQIRVIVIPDIEEVVWGRGVGWGRREIEMPKEIQAISATKIRERDSKQS